MANQVHVLPSSPASLENADLSSIEDLLTRYVGEQIVQAESFQDSAPFVSPKSEYCVAFPFWLKAGFRLTRH